MIGSSRAVATLVGTAAVAVLLWVAAQFHMHSTGGYWAALGVVAGAGLVLGVLQMRGRTGHPPAMLMAFLPGFVVGSWVLLAMQPHNVWGRHLILNWSHHIHVTGLVHDVGVWTGVIAFAMGYVLGTILEPAPAGREVAAAPAATTTGTTRTGYATNPDYERERAYADGAADEPMTAERDEVGTTSADGRTRVTH
jgi:hypothetical protein